MADGSDLTTEEFSTLRRLLADETSEVDQAVVRRLVGKRFVRRSDVGWSVTVQGHAAFLHELGREFDRPPEE